MRQPVVRIVRAETATVVDALTGPVGTEVTLRADFTADPPSGPTAFVWKVYPKAALVWGEYRTEPDFLRKATLKRDGVVYVTAYDEHGFALQSQTVKVRPSQETGEP